MVLLSDAVQFKKFDTRLVERSLARGVLSSKDLEHAVAQLPDDSENADWVSVDSFDQDGGGSEKSPSDSNSARSD
jgi:hypothetical protein